ncbi:MAG: heparinase II/III domain-containing protein, partial [Planctomycetota bacterium]
MTKSLSKTIVKTLHLIPLLFLMGQLPCQAAKTGWMVPQSHPRLLINRDELAPLRIRCGIEAYRDRQTAAALGIRFGSQRRQLDRLKQVAERLMLYHAGPDDLYAPAVLHLITGQLDRPDKYTDYITSELLNPSRKEYEMDAIVALDYCWEAIDPQKRNRIVKRLIGSINSMEARQSPFDHFAFYRKLCSLAAAIVLYDDQLVYQQPQMATKLSAVISLAQSYFKEPFLAFCRQRGPMPTSGQNGIHEEADIVLALEIWRSGAGQSLWPELADTVARAMEHYFYADTQYPGLNHGFIHDQGSHIPLNPGRVYRGFVPVVPWAIAKQARDNLAVWYAKRSMSNLTAPITTEIDRYQWVPLIYGPIDSPPADRRKCPLARNLGGGWVVMRSGWAPGDTILLFDVGQPHWTSRQHYDAGQFQIHRKGRLAIDSGDDVTYEAILPKDGRTTVAGKEGDWDHYFQATIAHNCVTVADQKHVMENYGKPWPAMGNQRLFEHDYKLTAAGIAQTKRVTGMLIAYESNAFYSYAAADLTLAYPIETVRSIIRQIIFINAGAVIVLDKVTAIEPDSIKTWHLQ